MRLKPDILSKIGASGMGEVFYDANNYQRQLM
jgi:hypothetical protein